MNNLRSYAGVEGFEPSCLTINLIQNMDKWLFNKAFKEACPNGIKMIPPSEKPVDTKVPSAVTALYRSAV